jgi:enoyl-[acyl-carrier protein] reductase II
MYPDILRTHIQKCKQATKNPFGVNVPLLYPDIDQHIKIIIEEKIPIVFTSAGNPTTWTSILKEKGITVVHVVSSVKFAKKSQDAGVDAIVAEGFEAGGHNGREETTTLCLIPIVRKAISIPLIAAGGIASGRAMLAAEILGADGVQIGSRFAASEESSAHINFKNKILETKEGDTHLALKKLTPVRLLKNKFFQEIYEAELRGASSEELNSILGKRRAKLGMFEGNMDDGELEIGQIAADIKSIQPAGKIVEEIWNEYIELKQQLCNEK